MQGAKAKEASFLILACHLCGNLIRHLRLDIQNCVNQIFNNPVAFGFTRIADFFEFDLCIFVGLVFCFRIAARMLI